MEQTGDEADLEIDVNKESSEPEKADNIQVMQCAFLYEVMEALLEDRPFFYFSFSILIIIICT